MGSFSVPAFMKGDSARSSRSPESHALHSGSLNSSSAHAEANKGTHSELGDISNESSVALPPQEYTALALISRSDIARLQLIREATVSGIALAILALISFSSFDDLRIRSLALYVEALIALATLVYGASSTISLGVRQVRALSFGPELCESLALIAATIGFVVTVFVAPETLIARTFFLSPVAITFIVALSRLVDVAIETEGSKRIGVSLRAMAPYARVFTPEESGGVLRVDSISIRPEQIIIVRAGEVVAVDGIVVHGIAEVRERRYGGSTVRKIKAVGAKIFAGSKVELGEVHVKTVCVQDESTIFEFIASLNKVIARHNEQEGTRVFRLWHAIAGIFGSLCAVLYWNDRGAELIALFDVAVAVLLVSLISRVVSIVSRLPRIAYTAWFMQGFSLLDETVLTKLAHIKTLVCEYSALLMRRSVRIRSFEVLDERVDEKTLISVLLSLFGDSDREIDRALYDHLRASIVTPLLFSVGDFNAYKGKGVIGVLQGVDFTVGTEALLLERGVQVQPSDIAPHESSVLTYYVAMKDEVVARISIELNCMAPIEDLITTANRAGIRPVIYGPEPVAAVDEFSRLAGLEKSSSYGAISEDALIGKMSSWDAPALYARPPVPEQVLETPKLSFAHFDEVLWNTQVGSVVLYGAPLKALAESVRSARRIVLLQRGLLIGAAVVTVALYVGACTGTIPTTSIALTSIAGAALAAILSLLFVVKRS
jgi:cation transport ATPase